MFRPTIIVLAIAATVLAAYDIWAASHAYEWTLSSNLLELAQKWPVIPFVLGFLAGHVFFPNRAAK